MTVRDRKVEGEEGKGIAEKGHLGDGRRQPARWDRLWLSCSTLVSATHLLSLLLRKPALPQVCSRQLSVLMFADASECFAMLNIPSREAIVVGEERVFKTGRMQDVGRPARKTRRLKGKEMKQRVRRGYGKGKLESPT